VDLPSGLTALAMSGSGWSCAVATETCTRGRTLSAGERSDLTLEVAVARDAPQRMQTLIQAAGGGAAPAARLDTADQDNVVSNGGEQVDPTYITRTAGG
jgi:large repetitive protein